MKSRLPNDRSLIRTAFVVIILLWLAAWWLTGAEPAVEPRSSPPRLSETAQRLNDMGLNTGKQTPWAAPLYRPNPIWE